MHPHEGVALPQVHNPKGLCVFISRGDTVGWLLALAAIRQRAVGPAVVSEAARAAGAVGTHGKVTLCLFVKHHPTTQRPILAILDPTALIALTMTVFFSLFVLARSA